jgi:hypothetical protein
LGEDSSKIALSPLDKRDVNVTGDGRAGICNLKLVVHSAVSAANSNEFGDYGRLKITSARTLG